MAGALLVTLKLTSSSDTGLPAVEDKDIPADWLSKEPVLEESPQTGLPEQTNFETGTLNPALPALTTPFNSAGTLSFLSADKPFGTESYSITSDANGANLESRGRVQI